MAEIKKRKTRMYEPWGYQDENNYQGAETILDNELESFFAGTSYNKDDNKIYFTNKDGETKAELDVSEFVKSDSIIDKVEYNDGILTITFTNGDVITIDLTELLDENDTGYMMWNISNRDETSASFVPDCDKYTGGYEPSDLREPAAGYKNVLARFM